MSDNNNWLVIVTFNGAYSSYYSSYPIKQKVKPITTQEKKEGKGSGGRGGRLEKKDTRRLLLLCDFTI